MSLRLKINAVVGALTLAFVCALLGLQLPTCASRCTRR